MICLLAIVISEASFAYCIDGESIIKFTILIYFHTNSWLIYLRLLLMVE